MPLIDDVQNILTELMDADSGWQSLFAMHGWPFTVQEIQGMSGDDLADKLLTHPLTVDRATPGFQDFAADGDRMIAPGRPSRSLLYHALASPNVVEHVDHTMLTDYPTLAGIDTVENFVYAAKGASISDLIDEARGLLGLTPAQPIPLAIAVFASEYRPAPETPHGVHADLCLARTGIARVGNQPPSYAPKRRGFVVFAEGDGDHDIRVLPCRYSVYLAIQAQGRRDRFGPVFSGSETVDDTLLNFWVPVHKLFDGDECLQGVDLQIDFDVAHFNQKIAKLVDRLKDTGFSTTPAAALNQPDYQFSDRMANLLPTDSEFGPGVVQPEPGPLVEAAEFQGQPLTFSVPPMGGAPFGAAFSPTLTVDATTAPPVRSWPEYAHVRQRTNPPEDINERPDVVQVATAGGYEAQHYKDFAGDGWVTPQVTDQIANGPLAGPDGNDIPLVSAFSLVTAPDFFPNVNQRQIYEWWSGAFVKAQNGELPDWWAALVNNNTWRTFWRRAPEPLSDERFAPDFQLPGSPFDRSDRTVTGIVTPLQQVDLSASGIDVPISMRNSFLPDSAAGAFAPGWDASVDRASDGTRHLSGYGLGSPFPEDAKLCAALSTFWPAAAPDISRTFFSVPFANGSVCPMTDDETGVGGDGVAWDDLTGPRVVDEDPDERVVEFPDYPHADYTRVALNNRFSIAKTSRVSLVEYQRRILAALRCYRALESQGNRNESHIFSFQQAAGGSELEEASLATGTTLTGPVHRFEVFTDEVRFSTGSPVDNASPPEFLNDNHQVRYRVQYTWTLFVGSGRFVLLRWQRGDGSVAAGNWTRADV